MATFRDIHGMLRTEVPPGFLQTGESQQTSVATGPTPEQETAAYGTGFAGLAGNANFGRVDPAAVSGYYNLANQRAFGLGNENINQILAERGFGPNRVGPGAEMAGRLSQNLEINRAGAELQMAQQAAAQQAALGQMIGQSRYGTLTRGGRTAQTGSQFALLNPYAQFGAQPTGLAPRSGMQNWSAGNWGQPANLSRITAGGTAPGQWEMAPQYGNPWATGGR